MPCHQLLTKNDRNPALKAAKWAAPALKSLSWNLKRFKPGWMSVFSGIVREQVPARRCLFSVAILQKDGREISPHVFFIFLPMPWHINQDSMLYSLLFSYCCSQSLPRRITHHWYLLFQKERKLRQRSSHPGCRQEPLFLSFSADRFFRCTSHRACSVSRRPWCSQHLSQQSRAGLRKGPAEPASCLSGEVPWAWGLAAQQDTPPTPLTPAVHWGKNASFPLFWKG